MVMCSNKEALVGFIYGELGPAEQHAFEQHLSECAECRAEVVGLQATRGQLASWTPPDADLGFRIVRGAAQPVRRFFAPAWGLAAAAVLVLAAAAAIANIEVKRSADGFTVRTGWGRPDRQLASAPAAPVVPVSAVTAAEMQALDQRLRELEAAAATRQTSVTNASAPSDAEFYRRVRQMISDAKSEQQRQVAALLAQVVRDIDRQRRVDMAAFQEGLRQIQGLTNAEIARTQNEIGQWLIRTNATRQEK